MPTPPTDPTTTRLPSLEPTSFRLGNGLRVNLLPDSSLPLVAVNLWYHVGSRNESPGRTGLAHLFEHMLFEGSVHVPGSDHFRRIQEVGGSANGTTWYDRTSYYETLPSHCLELALWLEADRMGFLLPALSAEKLAVQKEVVLNERRERIDNQPYGQALERLFARLYPDTHPYGWPVIGSPDDIAAATLEDVQGFLRRWYVPDNAVLTLAGDFDPADAARLTEHWFGELEPGPGPEPTAVPTGQAETGDEVLEDRVELERIYLGFRIPRYGTPDWYAADLLAAVLSWGKSSRLYRDLVHGKQIAQQVSASALPTEIEGSFLVIATATQPEGAAELGERILQHLDAVASGDVPEEALSRARNQVLNAYFDGLQTLEHRAELVSQFTTYLDRPTALQEELRSYLTLGAEDLSRVATRWLDGESAVRVRVVPS